ncbi:MAG: PQQ-binding-like beta-propeller repeat protein, partial [Planctomycetota bacterium]
MLLFGPAAWADWPVVRGDAAGTGVASTKLADSLDVLWKVEAADAAFEASAAIVDGVVYIGDDAGTLRAVKLSDGSTVWTQTFPDTGFLTPAAVADGRLYITDFDGVIHCRALADGGPIWRVATESESYNGPNLFGDALLVPTEAGDLVSLDAATGAENWRFTIDGPLRCSPSVATRGDGDRSTGHALLAGCDARLTAVDLSTGSETGAVGIDGQTGSTASLAGGRAYFGTESGEFLAVAVTDPANPAIAGRYRDPRRGQGIRTAAAANDRAVVYGGQGKAIY